MADQGLVDAIVVAYRLDQAVAATVVRRLQAADLDIELLSLDSAPEPQSPPVVPGARAFVVIFGASAGLETDPFTWLLAEEFLSQRPVYVVLLPESNERFAVGLTRSPEHRFDLRAPTNVDAELGRLVDQVRRLRDEATAPSSVSSAAPSAAESEPPAPQDSEAELAATFARLDESALKALGAANSASRAGGATEIRTKHLAAALYLTAGGSVRSVIDNAPLTETRLFELLDESGQSKVPDRSEFRDETPTSMPRVSRHVRAALIHARSKADELGQEKVNARHLLWGLLSVEDCSEAARLADAGVKKENIDFAPEPPTGGITAVASAQTDLPTTQDRLGYGGLVAALEALLTGKKTTFPLTIAISAPWGGGKSSVMRLLRDRLAKRQERPTWVMVEFPAWRYETGEQLWAAMAKATYDAALVAQGGWFARLRFRFALERRRVSLARAAVVATAVVATPAIGLIIGGQGAIALASTVGLGGVLVAAQTLWVSLADPFKRSVESFAAKSQIPHGDGFSLAAAGQVDSLMELLLRKGGRLAIFIDDLDRCSPDNLVRVIEAVNQIFVSGADIATRPERPTEDGRVRRFLRASWLRLRPKPAAATTPLAPPERPTEAGRVRGFLRAARIRLHLANEPKVTEPRRLVFIMGMDRQVVARGIEVRYAEVKKRLDEEGDPAGQSYGLAFLDKIIQLWVTLPTPARHALRSLLETVAGIDPALLVEEVTTVKPGGQTPRRIAPVPVTGGHRGQDVAPIVTGPTAVSTTETELVSELEEPAVDSRAVWEAMKVGADCLEPNPRQIKRFNNAFRLQFHVVQRTTAGTFTDEQLKDLARWIAVRLRWGALANAMDAEADLLWALERTARGGRISQRDVVRLQRQQTRTPRWFEKKTFADLPELMAVLKPKAGFGRLSDLPYEKFLRIA